MGLILARRCGRRVRLRHRTPSTFGLRLNALVPHLCRAFAARPFLRFKYRGRRRELMPDTVAIVGGFVLSLLGAVLGAVPILTLRQADVAKMRIWGPDGFLKLGEELMRQRKFAWIALGLIVAGSWLQLIGGLV